ncbi:hypothetical protein [Steroidobacter sp.]|uniref:hypothetical protein n=1 Tax=Steroidobacter sp. TaxID=1978227 RepID=UPI001A4B64F6|nr:hypothetical protein [Steroidobacter sp.]MBL8267637.1 hypothetical protein [Steroidobacter sp.]
MTEPFEERSREVFENSVERLDARTRSRLNQARQHALEEMKKGSTRRYWLAAPLGGLAAAALIAMIMIRTGAPTATQAEAEITLDDMDIVADGDNFELLQDVEFYSWLADDSSNSG